MSEFRCDGCSVTLEADEVLWATPNGVLTVSAGVPWCEGCAPEQPDYA
jgi:hypothetical protein